MMYELIYTARAVRDIQNLDETIKKRIGKSLIRYQKDPLKYAEKLTNSPLGVHIDSGLEIIGQSLILRITILLS